MGASYGCRLLAGASNQNGQTANKLSVKF